MAMNIAQYIVSIPLIMVLFFGLGFILNMVLKTTWFPTYASVVVVIAALFYLKAHGIFQIITLSFGILGAVISSMAINTLRKKGYRMF